LLNISVRTLDTYRTTIMLKLSGKSTPELVHQARRANLIDT
jgi:DNA-binding CsgD family transcriptional regulator